jgi:hypothetical protein
MPAFKIGLAAGGGEVQTRRTKVGKGQGVERTRSREMEGGAGVERTRQGQPGVGS